MLAFLLRLMGEGVEEMVVAGEEAEILGTGDRLRGLVRAGIWRSRALGETRDIGTRGRWWAGYCTPPTPATPGTPPTPGTLPGWTKKGAGGGPVQLRPGRPPSMTGW